MGESVSQAVVDGGEVALGLLVFVGLWLTEVG